MPKPNERKAGYEAALMNAGDWMKGKVVGCVSKGSLILRKQAELKDGQYLFVTTKEEIEELMEGRIPSAKTK